jgi:RNA polymerase sigma factor (sigma-70 family)
MAADATSEGADELAAERVDLARALLALPRRQREVVSLRYLADTSEADTATALGISNGSVKKYASQGLAALRAQIDVIKEEPV